MYFGDTGWYLIKSITTKKTNWICSETIGYASILDDCKNATLNTQTLSISNRGNRVDLSPIFNQVQGVLWIFIPLAILSLILKSNWFKGASGEFIVNLTARLSLNKNNYHLIKNITLPTPDGTTQIDHIIVSKYGVFVIETKNMKGWIFGSPRQKTWTQKFPKRSIIFQNPLHQNYKHVKTLQSLLGLDDRKIYSVVVIVGKCTFKTKMPDNVTKVGEYTRYIKTKSQIVLSELQIDDVIRKIDSGRLIPSLKTHTDHIKHVKQIAGQKRS